MIKEKGAPPASHPDILLRGSKAPTLPGAIVDDASVHKVAKASRSEGKGSTKAESPLTRENTHFVEANFDYSPRSGRLAPAFYAFLQDACAAAAQGGKKFLQVAFANGTRVFEFTKGEKRYSLNRAHQRGILDDFDD